jgi:hypothetical protein
MNFGAFNVILLLLGHAILTVLSLHLVRTLIDDQRKFKMPKRHIRKVFWLGFLPVANALTALAFLGYCLGYFALGIFNQCKKISGQIGRLEH